MNSVLSFWRWYLGAIAVILLLLAWGEMPRLIGRDFTVNFLDVGQGDAALIETETGETILIDGGPDLTVLEKIPKIVGYSRRRIDLVVLTHPDADHLTGLLAVLERYDVGQVLTVGSSDDSGLGKEWRAWLKDHQDRVWYAKRGQQYRIGNDTLSVLYPVQAQIGVVEPPGADTNQNTAVVMLEHGRSRFLFMGDASSELEEQLLLLGETLAADVVKVGHHGSRFSSSSAFLKAVKPALAVISVGRNPFGQPAQSVLTNLDRVGAKVYRTDQSGDIRIISTDHGLKVETERD